MGLRQQFSTTIYSWDGTLSTEVIFLPRADFLERVDDPKSALNMLDAKFLAPFEPQDHVRALATFLAAVDAGGQVLKNWQQEVRGGQTTSLEPRGGYLGFASELLASPRIPFEESPLTGASLEQLIALPRRVWAVSSVISWRALRRGSSSPYPRASSS